MADRFRVDKDNSDNETFYVDVEGLGTVQIKVPEENPSGIQVYVYPLHVVDKSVASTFAAITDLIQE